MSNKVFVYGTLKSGNKVRGLHMFPGAEFIGDATTDQKFHMLDLGSFPGVRISNKQQPSLSIAGQVFDVSDETFAQLDAIEGYPVFYDRKQVNTSKGKAWMYILPNNGEYDDYFTHDESDRIELNNSTVSWK